MHPSPDLSHKGRGIKCIIAAIVSKLNTTHRSIPRPLREPGTRLNQGGGEGWSDEIGLKSHSKPPRNPILIKTNAHPDETLTLIGLFG